MSSSALALRMLRGQAAKAWLFVFCIAVGVAARVSVASFLASLDAGLGAEARRLLGADLVLGASTEWTPAQLADLAQAVPPASAFSRRVSLLSMASAQGRMGARSRLVQLAGVDAAYPLLGDLKLEGGVLGDAASLQQSPRAYVQSELLTQLGIGVGGRLRLGRLDFVVAGLLRDEPGLGAGPFSLGPRVLVGLPQLKASGLIGWGSRVDHEILIRLPKPQDADALAAGLRRAWGLEDGTDRFAGPSSQRLRVRSSREAQGELKRFFERLADYLGLVGLAALLLGGVGVANVTRSFVREAAPSVGVLRSLGAGPGVVRRVFGWQAALLGLTGGGLGCVLGVALQALWPRALSAFLPVALTPAVDFGGLAWGLTLGLLTALAFGLDPVWAAGSQSAAAQLRDEDPAGRQPWGLVFWRLGVAVVFAILAAVEARSWIRGPGALALLLLAGLLLQGAGALLLPRLAALRALRLGAWRPPLALRQALGNLARPGLRAGSSLVALGLAALLLGVLSIHEHSLLKELDPGRSHAELPAFFMIDIQRDQVEPLKAFLRRQAPGVEARFSPMVRARYLGKLGVPQASAGSRKGFLSEWEEEDGRRLRSREQNLSWRDALGPGESLVAGRWMDPNAEEVEASLEEWFARRLKAQVGDVLRFDVQGVEVQARVTSLRKVHWASFQPNFFILLSPWAVRDAPQTWIGSLGQVGDAARRAELQAAVVERFPNVTLFDVAEGTAKIWALLKKIQDAVRLVAWFSLATGLVVLAGLALAGLRSRRAEAALLKVLGAGRGTLVGLVLTEFGLLAALAAALGLLLSLGLGWVLMPKLLDLPFAPPWGSLAALALLFAATGAAVGLTATLRVYSARPAEVLRED